MIVFAKKLREGELDEKEIEIEVVDNNSNSASTFDIPGMPGAQMGIMNLSDILGKMGSRTKVRKTTVRDAFKPLIDDESEKLLDQEQIIQEALRVAENDGIVFIDEIDKIATRDGGASAAVSREGVQRDLLPLVEGTTIATKYGQIKTDHILLLPQVHFMFLSHLIYYQNFKDVCLSAWSSTL